MENQKLSEKVSARIRQEILDGRYKAGDKIPAEPELMKTYEVGRSSIREAIKSLAMAGILKVQQGLGTFVNELQPEENMTQRLRVADFDEINVVRKLLEEEIVKLAVENHTATELSEIEKHLNLRKQAIINEDRQACTNADISFHMAIAHASHNKVLAELYQNFSYTIRAFFTKREAQGIGHFAISHHLHEDLFRAIKARRKKQAQYIIREILGNNY
ncbi:DNA-binding FadR family transcriptional regulator [Mucilaginibacter gracilis]|uniref:DNA-binding FadR family transcriptional regulator n=1 Tax=Mucilaginibacter gracilis TaxID=423350 RepID=A0A495IUW0_9SPHI|nr:FadR/GntR family transcriptional regulator [Mucilaginibacter gracilis]RKR80352.1 DNA-binding FadR family transcriptional regulator [Mucilaginibacter gracilis]